MNDCLPRVLIVEDNLMIAMLLEEFLEQCGCTAAATAGTLAQALAAADLPDIDCAVLDVNLGQDRVWPAAEKLAERSIPFVISTGYGIAEFPARFRGYPLVAKPVTQGALARGLSACGIAVTP